ncbi:MmpS family protein [Kribbella sp. NBC_01505]|uniref:MmpS family transport accessory protein n=1 Tax=Kribbella sp. NBC_01505 TaxID=2903580 RepID=UPI003868B4EC
MSAAAPVPPRRRSRLPFVVLILVGVFGLLIVGGFVGVYIWAKNNLERDVTYEVTGTVKQAGLVYTTEDNPGWGKQGPVAVPWSTSFHTWMTRSARVSAVVVEGEKGTVTCTVRIDGEVVATQTDDEVVVCLEPGR